MYPFIETIQIKQKQAVRIEVHQQRVNHTLMHFYPTAKPICLKEEIERVLELYPSPTLDSSQECNKAKCRLVYDACGIKEITIAPYTMRQVRTLRLIDAGDTRYDYKSAIRVALNNLFEQRGNTDDVLLVKHGAITDTSICNIAFLHDNAWFTPSTPLLAGTHRATLLEQGIITEQFITIDDLQRFSRIRLFNAMIDWGEIDLPINCIVK